MLWANTIVSRLKSLSGLRGDASLRLAALTERPQAWDKPRQQACSAAPRPGRALGAFSSALSPSLLRHGGGGFQAGGLPPPRRDRTGGGNGAGAGRGHCSSLSAPPPPLPCAGEVAGPGARRGQRGRGDDWAASLLQAPGSPRRLAPCSAGERWRDAPWPTGRGRRCRSRVGK